MCFEQIKGTPFSCDNNFFKNIILEQAKICSGFKVTLVILHCLRNQFSRHTFLFWQNSLLWIVEELTGGGSVSVAVGVGDM